MELYITRYFANEAMLRECFILMLSCKQALATQTIGGFRASQKLFSFCSAPGSRSVADQQNSRMAAQQRTDENIA